MKISIIAGAAAAALTTGAAQAEGPKGSVYLGFNLGAAWQQDIEGTYDHQFVTPDFSERVSGDFEEELGLGAVFKLLVGYHVTSNIALELESSARASAIDGYGGDDAAGTGFTGVNAVFHPATAGRVRPYIGIGLGSGTLHSTDDEFDNFDSALAYQLKGGFVLPVGQHHGFVFEASYVGNGTFESENSYSDEFVSETYSWEIETGSFDLSAGYRFYFGGNR
jgi:outer membrane protein W